jgi:hypothetical protein
VTTVVAPAHRNAGNLEGAFPLLFLGAAIAVGGVVLALESPTPRIDRVEIWQFLVALGAVVVAAGIFSVFFAEHDTALPAPSDIPVGATDPSWSEGPIPPVAPPGPPAVLPPATTVAGIPASPEVPRVAAAPVGTAPGPSDEIDAIMSQLDQLTKEIFSAPRPPPAMIDPPSVASPAERTAQRPAAPGCADCGRVLPVGGPRLPCEICGRPLCEDCALDAASHRGTVACQNCRSEASGQRSRR